MKLYKRGTIRENRTYGRKILTDVSLFVHTAPLDQHLIAKTPAHCLLEGLGAVQHDTDSVCPLTVPVQSTHPARPRRARHSLWPRAISPRTCLEPAESTPRATMSVQSWNSLPSSRIIHKSRSSNRRSRTRLSCRASGRRTGGKSADRKKSGSRTHMLDFLAVYNTMYLSFETDLICY